MLARIASILVALAVLVVVGIGCFKFGAEFCPPTVIMPNEGATITVTPKLVHDAAAELRDGGAG